MSSDLSMHNTMQLRVRYSQIGQRAQKQSWNVFKAIDILVVSVLLILSVWVE
jgi:hypothetical protein